MIDMIVIHRPKCQLQREMVRIILGSMGIHCKIKDRPINTISVTKADEEAAKTILFCREMSDE